MNKGVDWRIESAWPISTTWVITIGVGCVLVVALLMLMRSRAELRDSATSSTWYHPWVLLAARIGVIAVVCWMIGGWRLARFETDLPDVILLVDDSRSMNLSAASGDQTIDGDSRWEVVSEFLTNGDGEVLDRLNDAYRPRLNWVGEQRRELTGKLAGWVEAINVHVAEGEQSRIGDHLLDAIENQRGKSTAAVILLSDGIVVGGTDLERAAEALQAAKIPLFIGRVGSTEAPPQTAIVDLIVESTAMVGDVVTVLARIEWPSNTAPPQVRLIDQATGRQLDIQQPQRAGDGSGTVELSFIADRAGTRNLLTRVDAFPGELALDDNESLATIDIRDDSFRVLLIQGGPSYEFRFLKHVLERATSRDGARPLIELSSVLQRGDPEYADQDRSALRLPPIDSATLEALDVIILSDCDPAALGRVLQNKIVDLVTERGVSLLVIAGPDHLPGALVGTPLANLLPIEPEDVRSPTSAKRALGWELTPMGRAMPNLAIGTATDVWQQVPSFYWLAKGGTPRPAARVLLESDASDPEFDAQPILLSQLVGNGQVWLQMTDETFRLSADAVEADYHRRYWLQLIRALARRRVDLDDASALLDVVGDRFHRSDAIPFRVRLDAGMTAAAGGRVEIAVIDQSGHSVPFNATPDARGGGDFRGIIEGLEAGSYRAVVTRPSGGDDPASDTFVVREEAQELRDTIVDKVLLERVTTMTSGGVWELASEGDQLLDALPTPRATRIRPLPPQPIWNHWSVALTIFSLLCGEWILRRRWGLA